jgi:hypothetical protein
MKPHKHAALIHAWADGAEIEYFATPVDKWQPCPAPFWSDDVEYRIRDPYHHLKAAAKDPTKQIRFKAADFWADANSSWAWTSPLEEYEIREKPKEPEDPYKELKLAAQDLTKQIRWFGGEWQDSNVHGDWIWAGNPENYEIRTKPDPYAELKLAAADPTKQIRLGGGEWHDAGERVWLWVHTPDRYQIRNKPAAKRKVKLLAWLNSAGLVWTEDSKVHAIWIRVPSEDKEIEVEI